MLAKMAMKGIWTHAHNNQTVRCTEIEAKAILMQNSIRPICQVLYANILAHKNVNLFTTPLFTYGLYLCLFLAAAFHIILRNSTLYRLQYIYTENGLWNLLTRSLLTIMALTLLAEIGIGSTYEFCRNKNDNTSMWYNIPKV